MLALEVKHVNGESNVMEEWIALNHLCQRTVVVEEDVVWFDISLADVLPVWEKVCRSLNDGW